MPKMPSNIAAPPTPTNDISVYVDGVPIDLITYFNINLKSVDGREKKQLSDIYEIVKKNSGTDGDVLLRISEIERKLGSPNVNETRFSKIWSYLKINDQINELEKKKKAYELADRASIAGT